MSQGTGTKQREKLSRPRIVGAALQIMDSDGLEAVTMRRVGRDLGVEAMSLYNHVKDKDDLLDGIRELVLSEFEDPGSDGPWEERTRRAARSWREVLRAHPNTLILISESKGPDMAPGSIRPTEIALRLLGEIGLSEEDTVKAFCAFGGYIVGFVLFEVGVMHTTDRPVGAPDAERVLESIPADEFPCFTSSLSYLMQGDIDERFDYGLDLLLAGLRVKATTGTVTD